MNCFKKGVAEFKVYISVPQFRVLVLVVNKKVNGVGGDRGQAGHSCNTHQDGGEVKMN